MGRSISACRSIVPHIWLIGWAMPRWRWRHWVSRPIPMRGVERRGGTRGSCTARVWRCVMLPDLLGTIPRLFIFDADDTLRHTLVPGQPSPRAADEWELLPGVAER